MKKNIWKRLIALMMTLILSLEAAPLSALADTLDDISWENEAAVTQELEEAKTYATGAEDVAAASDTTASDTTTGDTATGDPTTSGTTTSNFTYTVVDSTSVTITGYTGAEAELVIPDTIEGLPVTVIKKETFAENETLTSVVLPDSITTIGHHAFMNCTNLTSINYPMNWIHTTDGDDEIEYSYHLDGAPFYGCTSLTSIEVPEGVTEIAYNAFANSCIKVVSLPSTLTTIRRYAFYGCQIETIDIPESVNNMEGGAFEACSELTAIEFPAGMTFVPYVCFKDCTSLTKVTLPDGMTRIYGYAFENCTALTEMKLPNSITTIGHKAFLNCTSLTSVNYPMNWIHTTDGYDEIEYNFHLDGSPFQNCTSLTSMEVPEGVTEIAYNAFANSCIKEVSLPSTLTTIRRYAFYGCALETIDVPDSVTNMEHGAFEACSELTAIEFPAGMTFVPYVCFKDCASLTKVTLPDGMTRIYGYAFEDCTALTEIKLPNSITTIGHKAFFNCTNLTSINYPMKWIHTTDGYDEIEYDYHLDGSPFQNCISLTSMEVPEGVTEIAYNAFANSCIKEVSLPSTLTTIRRYAFYGCALETIDIPDSVTNMEHGAFEACDALTSVNYSAGMTYVPEYCFMRCHSLKSIFLPDTVTNVKTHAFYECENLSSFVVNDVKISFEENAIAGCPNMTIYAPWYSYATIEAIKQGLSFVSTDNEKSELKNTVLVDAKTNYSYDTSYINIGGYINNTIEWEYTPDLSTKTLSIYIPSQTELDESTIYVNDELCTDYEWGNNILTIELPSKSGKVVFHTKPIAAGEVYGYAVLDYYYSDNSGMDVIDIIRDTISSLTISAKEVTSSETVAVSGIAPASASVELYVNDVLSGTVTASKAGKYTGTVKLDNPVEGKRYVIEAKCVNGEESYETQTRVKYQKDLPEVTGFNMYYNNHQDAVLDLLNVEKNHYTTYNPDIPFTFTVDMSHAEEVDSVYVTTVRKNQKYYMEAEYDETLGMYVASGFFENALGAAVVPGVLRVEYQTKYEQPIATEDVEFEAYAENHPLRSGTTVTTTEEDGKTTYTMDMTQAFVQMGENAGDVLVDFTVETVDEMAGTAVKDALSEAGQVGDLFSYFVPGIDDDRYIVTADYTDPNTYVMWVKDAGSLTETITKYTIDLRTDGQYWSSIDDFAQGLSTFNTAVSVGSDIIEYRQDYYDLCSEIRQSTHIHDKSGAIKRADQLYGDQVAYTVLMASLPILVTAVGITGPVGIGFALLCGMIGATSSVFWDYRADQILGGEASLRWAIDPSGYVYEGVTSNRIEGVTVYAYWKENLEDEEAILWNAEEFDQNNPLITDGEGRYSWDVPEGFWQVKCVKDGYETTYSEWLEVPPPQTEVNLAMIPIAAPVLEAANVMEDKTEIIFSQYMDPANIADIVLKNSDGNEIAYTLEYDKSETDLEGNVYAKKYTLVYSDGALSQGKKVTVELPATVASADGKPVSAVTIEETCASEMEVAIEDEIVLDNAKQHQISIYVENYNPEKTVTVTSDYEQVLKVTEVKMNEDGTGTVIVEKGLPGVVVLTVAVEGTSVAKEISVSVTREEHVHQYTTIVTKASTCDEAGTSADVCTCGDVTNETALPTTEHTVYIDEAVAPTCLAKGLTEGARCTVCNTTVTPQSTIPAKGHTVVTQAAVAATFETDGKTAGTSCSVCNTVITAQTVVPKVTAILNKTAFTYTGKVQKPKVTVTDTTGKVLGVDCYTVTYSSGCKNVGGYKVTVTLKNGYSGTTTLDFAINPKGTTLSSVKGASKSLKVKWKKQNKQITGYEIQYSTKKNFKGAKITTVKGAKKTSKTIKKLLKKKKYFVRIRTYKTVKGMKYYSAWSKSKNTKTK